MPASVPKPSASLAPAENYEFYEPVTTPEISIEELQRLGIMGALPGFESAPAGDEASPDWHINDSGGDEFQVPDSQGGYFAVPRSYAESLGLTQQPMFAGPPSAGMGPQAGPEAGPQDVLAEDQAAPSFDGMDEGLPPQETDAEDPIEAYGEKRQGQANQMRTIGQLESEAIAGKATSLAKLAKHDRKAAQDILNFHNSVEKAAQDWIGQLDAERQEMRDFRVDPNRLFKDRSTASNVMTLVGAFLGGWVAPYNGGKNQFLEMIEADLDRDVQAQMADFEAMQAGIQSGTNLFDRNMKVYGDKATALAQTKAMQRQALVAEGLALAEQFASPKAKAEAEKLALGLEATTEKEQLELYEQRKASARADKNAETQARFARGAGGGGKGKAGGKAEPEPGVEASNSIRNPITKKPMGTFRFGAGDTIGARRMSMQAQTEVNNYNEARSLWHDYRELIKKTDPVLARTPGFWTEPEGRKILAVHGKLTVAETKLTQGARASDYDQKNTIKYIAAPERLFDQSGPLEIVNDRIREHDAKMETWLGTNLDVTDPNENPVNYWRAAGGGQKKGEVKGDLTKAKPAAAPAAPKPGKTPVKIPEKGLFVPEGEEEF